MRVVLGRRGDHAGGDRAALWSRGEMTVDLTESEASRHLELLRVWLARPHVARWWGGHGLGPKALLLVADLLSSQGVSSAGLGTDLENQRACRAFHKAGFRHRAEFEEKDRRLAYFTRVLGTG